MNSLQNEINSIMEQLKSFNSSSFNLYEVNIPLQFSMKHIDINNEGILIKDILLYHYFKFISLINKY